MAAAPASRAQEIALIIETAGQRRRVVIAKSPFTIGRAEECDANISDFRVSRLHARVERDARDGAYYISDAGSRHGTFVNGQRAERSRIQNNDEITLGVSGLRLLIQEGTPPSSATQVLLRK